MKSLKTKISKINKWPIIVIGLGIYALALIVTAPATLIDTPLQKISNGQLHLVEAQGTIWSGSGQLEMRDINERSALTKNVMWHFQPWELTRAQLTYEITLDPGSPAPFQVNISWSHIELTNVDVNVPANALGLGLPKLAALGLTGDAQLQITQLFITRTAINGSATLQWHNAGSVLTPVSPLGNYELYIEGRGSRVHATLRTLQKGSLQGSPQTPLQLDGDGSWGNGHNSGFLATAHIAPPFQQQLAPFLRLIAVEHSDGSFALSLK